ncbi:hypothetical protein [Marinoscillum sp.]|uniref:hypothetical protein n=1 Tax=Marinoscillum sp. TaxID=2024838 RepID=UPI003BACBDF7
MVTKLILVITLLSPALKVKVCDYMSIASNGKHKLIFAKKNRLDIQFYSDSGGWGGSAWVGEYDFEDSLLHILPDKKYVDVLETTYLLINTDDYSALVPLSKRVLYTEINNSLPERYQSNSQVVEIDSLIKIGAWPVSFNPEKAAVIHQAFIDSDIYIKINNCPDGR